MQSVQSKYKMQSSYLLIHFHILVCIKMLFSQINLKYYYQALCKIYENKNEYMHLLSK